MDLQARRQGMEMSEALPFDNRSLVTSKLPLKDLLFGFARSLPSQQDLHLLVDRGSIVFEINAPGVFVHVASHIAFMFSCSR